MKHIWYIDENAFYLDEGYVKDNNYRDYTYYDVYFAEDSELPIDTVKTENIFDNKETATHMLKGMIEIERNRLQRYIEECKRKDECLFDKLLAL